MKKYLIMWKSPLKVLIALTFLCVSAVSFANQVQSSFFSGEWNHVDNRSNSRVPYSDFSIKLEVNDNIVEGQYCYITRSGAKIDCDTEDNYNIKGKVTSGGSLIIDFRSFFGATGGVAEIVRTGDKITWKVTKSPTGGDFYGPMLTTLSKTSASCSGSEYKVVSAKAYLYDDPHSSGKSKSYIVKGDVVTLIQISEDNNYQKVRYVSANGKATVRWIRCIDIDRCSK